MALEARNIYFRYNNKQLNTQTNKQSDKQPNKLFNSQLDKQLNKQPNFQFDKQPNFQFDKQSNSQSDKHPWILENLSIKIERGERIAIFAPSGYGKTTLCMLLAGYLEPTKGQIFLDGKPLPKKGICPVQLIYQHPEKAINPRWRLKRVLEESGELKQDVLEELGIESAWLERFPRELSGGELQRFCVARALTCGANYLICDEISTMLDAITQAQIWNAVLREADKHNMGIITVTHNKYLAERVANQTIDLTSC